MVGETIKELFGGLSSSAKRLLGLPESVRVTWTVCCCWYKVGEDWETNSLAIIFYQPNAWSASKRALLGPASQLMSIFCVAPMRPFSALFVLFYYDMSVSRTDSIISPTKENSLSTAANGHIFTLIEGQTSIFVSVWMRRRPRKNVLYRLYCCWFCGVSPECRWFLRPRRNNNNSSSAQALLVVGWQFQNKFSRVCCKSK